MNDATSHLRVFLHESVLEVLPARLRRTVDAGPTGDEFGTAVIVMASALVADTPAEFPDWVDAGTRYLAVADVPEPVMLRVPSVLRLHKPHLRLHVTRDRAAVARFVVAQARNAPWEGLVDAYLWGGRLVTVLGDLSIREFPIERLRMLSGVDPARLGDFEIDPGGSWLHWDDGDLFVGPSQLLQAVDPMYLAEVEVQRYAMAKVSLALLDMRRERGLRQSDIPGLSERHLRRLENEVVRLTVDASEKLAEAFGLTLSEFLEELGRRVTGLRDRPVGTEDGVLAGAD